MIHFAKTNPPDMINQKVWVVRVLTAGILVVMVVAQLFTYETFAAFFHYAGNWSAVIAAWIVTLEIAALPYLLSMPLSGAARLASRLAGWIIAVVWLVGSLSLLSSEESGILGTVVSIPSGFAVGVAVILTVMTAFSSLYQKRSRSN
jgi:hypothetical protein